MKKLLLIGLTIILSLSCLAQDGPGWFPQRTKVNFRDSTNFVKLPLHGMTDTLATQSYVRTHGGTTGDITATSLSVGDGGNIVVLDSITSDGTNIYFYSGSTILVATPGAGEATWGGISGTLTNQIDLALALGAKADLDSPVLTGTPTVPGYVPTSRTVNSKALTSNINITASDISLGNVTNESKATMFNSPVFTGTATIPSPFTLGATSVTSIGIQLNYLNTATGKTGSGAVVLNDSPTLAGAPAAPTAAAGTNTTQIATTAFVTGGINARWKSYTSNLSAGAETDVTLTDITTEPYSFLIMDSDGLDITDAVKDSTGVSGGTYHLYIYSVDAKTNAKIKVLW